jgi:hypothetical protein
VELTHDAQEFMDWAGLDSDRFNQGFNTEADYFLWLTCQSHLNLNDSEGTKEKYEEILENRFPQGWKRMAGRRKEADPTKMPRGHGKIRLEVMARFRDWLLTTAYGVEAPVSPKADKAVTPADSTQVTADLAKLDISDKTPVKPISAREQNLVDPSKPQELSPIDLAALDYFKKTSEWQSAFNGRKKEATIMAERQHRNNKESADHQKAKEDALKAKQMPAPVAEGVPTVITGDRRNLKAEDMDEGVSL